MDESRTYREAIWPTACGAAVVIGGIFALVGREVGATAVVAGLLPIVGFLALFLAVDTFAKVLGVRRQAATDDVQSRSVGKLAAEILQLVALSTILAGAAWFVALERGGFAALWRRLFATDTSFIWWAFDTALCLVAACLWLRALWAVRALYYCLSRRD